MEWSVLRPYSVNILIVMQPSIQAQCNPAITNRLRVVIPGILGTGVAGITNSVMCAAVKEIGNRLGRDSVAAGVVVSSTDKVSLRCMVILSEDTDI